MIDMGVWSAQRAWLVVKVWGIDDLRGAHQAEESSMVGGKFGVEILRIEAREERERSISKVVVTLTGLDVVEKRDPDFGVT